MTSWNVYGNWKSKHVCLYQHPEAILQLLFFLRLYEILRLYNLIRFENSEYIFL